MSSPWSLSKRRRINIQKVVRGSHPSFLQLLYYSERKTDEPEEEVEAVEGD